MKKLLCLLTLAFAFVVLSAMSTRVAHAQIPDGILFTGGILLPKNPTSDDNLKFVMPDRTCGDAFRYKGNSYISVSMEQNNITVFLGERIGDVFTLYAPRPDEEIDLGRLPGGKYTLTVIDFPGNPNANSNRALLPNKEPFTVIGARATKAAPYVRLDYSGAWWDPNDPGWGLFIWQDVRSATDTMLAAWFSYTPDGKTMWYTFQPAWNTSLTTAEAPLLQSSRPPGATSPPPGTTSRVAVGTASLDFANNFSTSDVGRITYTFTSGTKLVRTIQRLKP